MTSKNAATRSRRFGAIASSYDELRPQYAPVAISYALEEYSGDPIVEIGSGTGIATRQLLSGGASVLCIEPDRAMTEVMMQHETRPSLPVWNGRFEDWAATADTGSVGSIVSAEAWHWVEQPLGWSQAARVLADGAPIVFLSNRAVRDFPWPEDRMAELLGKHLLQAEKPHVVDLEDDSEPTTDLWPDGDSVTFERPVVKSFAWTRTQTSDDFVAQLCTSSALLGLDQAARDDFARSALTLISDYAGGEVTTRMVTKVESSRRHARDH